MTTVDFTGYKRIVQYFYDPEPKDESKTPIWCLGRQYVRDEEEEERGTPVPPHGASNPGTAQLQAISNMSSTTVVSHDQHPEQQLAHGAETGGKGNWPAQFLDDFESRIWFTYRSGFSVIARSQDAPAMTFSVRLRNLTDRGGFTSDTGFGCMIRSGQSLLANAILVTKLGRDWRRGSTVREEKAILSMFADDPLAPYSIHRFVEHGASACGKHPGEWFGPSATASCIQELANNDQNTDFRVYVTGDGSDVYEDSFMSVAKQHGKPFTPTLILVGTRLGIEKVTPAYHEALISTLKMPQAIGIAGGRPSASHYFVGSQGSNLFYLDPHQTRAALPLHKNSDDMTDEEVESCHTRRLRMINVKEMDPSMLIGFLIRDEHDWKEWRQSVTAAPGKVIIHVADKYPAPYEGLGEREGALDEVESFDDNDDNDDNTI